MYLASLGIRIRSQSIEIFKNTTLLNFLYSKRSIPQGIREYLVSPFFLPISTQKLPNSSVSFNTLYYLMSLNMQIALSPVIYPVGVSRLTVSFAVPTPTFAYEFIRKETNSVCSVLDLYDFLQFFWLIFTHEFLFFFFLFYIRLYGSRTPKHAKLKIATSLGRFYSSAMYIRNCDNVGSIDYWLLSGWFSSWNITRIELIPRVMHEWILEHMYFCNNIQWEVM